MIRRSKSIANQYLALRELLATAPAYECLDTMRDPSICRECGKRHRKGSKAYAAHKDFMGPFPTLAEQKTLTIGFRRYMTEKRRDDAR